MNLPTVCIVNPAAKSGFTRINETDFDPSVHVLFDEAAGKPAPAPAPAPQPAIEIPAHWKSLHWKQRVALAEKLNGDAVLEPAAGQTQTEAADAVIEAALASRAAA